MTEFADDRTTHFRLSRLKTWGKEISRIEISGRIINAGQEVLENEGPLHNPMVHLHLRRSLVIVKELGFGHRSRWKDTRGYG